MRNALIRSGLVAVLALGGPAAAGADVIHLTNGSQLRVEAWRDAGDAVEVAIGGGLMRISKRDIRKIDGKASRYDLPMYSTGSTGQTGAPAESEAASAASAAAGSPGTPGTIPSEVTAMQDLLAEGQALFGQGALTSGEKAVGFRRLAERWQALSVPERLRASHARASQAFQAAVEAYQADSQNPGDPTARVSGRVEAARAELSRAQQEVQGRSGS
jgi:hypothetical protein